MIVPESFWEKYIDKLRQINDRAADEMQTFMDLHRDEDGEWNSAEARQNVLDYAYGLSNKYGTAAATLVCDMYDQIAEKSLVVLPPAAPAEVATYSEVAKAVNGTMKQSKRADVIASTVGRLVKQAGADTAIHNAIRDHAEWAWVPRGVETCAFCMTLASRGWLPASAAQLAGHHAQHIHAHCDCMFAIRHNRETEYEGYDPDVYLDIYENADTSSAGLHNGNYQSESTARINGIRREQYAKHKRIRP